MKHYRGNINLEDFCARDKDGWKALELLTTAELGISRLLSLRRKFQYDLTVAEGAEKQDAMEEMERFIQSLCRCGEVRVPGAARGPAGRLIQALFRESNQITHPRPSGLPPPVVKQFTLREVQHQMHFFLFFYKIEFNWIDSISGKLFIKIKINNDLKTGLLSL